MAQLREVFAELGYEDIKTYVNSGNVVFSGRKASQRKIEDALRGRVRLADPDRPAHARGARRGRSRPTRSASRRPTLSRYLVSFSGSTSRLDASKLDDVTPGRNEEYAILGREAYLWLPDGVHSSPLAKAVTDRRFGVVPRPPATGGRSRSCAMTDDA